LLCAQWISDGRTQQDARRTASVVTSSQSSPTFCCLSPAAAAASAAACAYLLSADGRRLGGVKLHRHPVSLECRQLARVTASRAAAADALEARVQHPGALEQRDVASVGWIL